MTRAAIVAIALIVLSACASILAGTTQELVVNTNPAEANCVLNRAGTVIGRINPTPGGVTIQKTKDDINIECSKEGFQTATYLLNSGIQPATWGNIVAGGGIGWAIDSARGADNYYESPVNVSLVPN